MTDDVPLVLVTGGTGFVGAHCILSLLQHGYRVRTTIRSIQRADFVRQMLRTGGANEEQISSVQFQVADLTSDSGWGEACCNCSFVLHVASPMSDGPPKHENDLIIPARDGTLRLLAQAKMAGVKRVVMTSSWATIAFGHPTRVTAFTEEDWTVVDNPSSPIPAYHKSKTVAEKAAWEWMAQHGEDMGFVSLNPTGIIGPILAKEAVSSNELLVSMLNGQMPGVLKLSFPLVDVRDFADLNIRAMTEPAADGHRFVAVSEEGSIWCRDVANILKKHLGDGARKVSSRELPNWAFKVFGWFDANVAEIVPELGVQKLSTSEKARAALGWQTRSAEKTVVDAAESLIRFEVVR